MLFLSLIITTLDNQFLFLHFFLNLSQVLTFLQFFLFIYVIFYKFHHYFLSLLFLPLRLYIHFLVNSIQFLFKTSILFTNHRRIGGLSLTFRVFFWCWWFEIALLFVNGWQLDCWKPYTLFGIFFVSIWIIFFVLWFFFFREGFNPCWRFYWLFFRDIPVIRKCWFPYGYRLSRNQGSFQ